METTGKREPRKGPFDFTWLQILGLALVLAGFSESLRNLWRWVEGEDALLSLILCLAFMLAGGWLVYREKKK